MSKGIVLFYDSQLPIGTANATRIVSFAHIFKELGYNPILLGVNFTLKNPCSGIYDGIEYDNLNFPAISCTGINKGKRVAQLKDTLNKWLDKYREKNDLAYIFYSNRNGLADFFIKYSRRTQIPIIFNHVEWHMLSMFSGRFGFIPFLENRYELYFKIHKVKNILAISSFLEGYYAKKGCATLRIPTIVNIRNYEWSSLKDIDDKLIIAYAGKPGKKDAIINVVHAIAKLSECEQQKIEFRIFGLTNTQLENEYRLNDKTKKILGKSVFCMGKIPYEQVQIELRKADFTVLLRKKRRNAQAGFPTKVGESMACGVPVIANLTSDIGLYLHDGVEGFVCKDESIDACFEALKRALALNSMQKEKMRLAARAQAENSFDYRAYNEKVKKYLETLSPS